MNCRQTAGQIDVQLNVGVGLSQGHNAVELSPGVSIKTLLPQDLLLWTNCFSLFRHISATVDVVVVP